MEENLIKVYVKLDANSVITGINSNIFLSDTTDWTEVDEGQGDKYSHAQSNYLDKELMDSNGKYNYKLADGKVVELTDAEKESLFPTPTDATITDIDRISALESAISKLMEV